MPQLPTFTAQVGGAQPSGGRRASAEDLVTGARQPADLSGLASGVTKAANVLIADKEDTESRAALISSSEIRAKYAQELDKAAYTGTDLEALKQKMTDDLAKVGENFQTRRGTEALALYTANTGLMFDEQANAIEVRRASATAKLEGAKFLQSASSIIQSNPNYLPVAEKNAEDLVGTFSRISPEQRALIANEIKQDLNMASAVSAARIDPEGTKKRLDAGEWNLSPEQRNTAVNKAETEMRAKRAEESYARAEAERERHRLDDKARDTHFADIIAGKASRRSIMDDVTLLPATREHLINVMETRAREGLNAEKRSNPVVLRNLWMRINAPEGDPSKIYNGDAIFEAVRTNQINVSDASGLNNMVAQQKDENGRTIGTRLGGLMSVVGRALSQDPQFTAQPALVAEIQMDYQARVLDKVDQLRKDKKNPGDVFDPTNREYVGSREFIQESIVTAKNRMRSAGIAGALEKGTMVEHSGKVWEYLGGDPGSPKNFKDRGPIVQRAPARSSSGRIQ